MRSRRKSAGSSPTNSEATETPAEVPATVPPQVDPTRVEQVLAWLIEGHREHHVVEAVVHHWPDQNVRDLMFAIVDRLKKAGSWSPGAVRGWCFEAAKDLYRRMVEIGDFAGALRAVKQIHDMAGVE